MKRVPRDKIRRPVEAMLWGKAAGRCEFEGCNRSLWKSSVTQEIVNQAQKAHIYSVSENWERGNDAISAEELNEIGNLMLVCYECHRKIDAKLKGGERYSADRLRRWKADHESRVERVTGIDPSKRSHVLLYGANIGVHSSPLAFSEAADAMFPQRYPAEDKAIELSLRNSAIDERDAAYWLHEGRNLRRLFEKRVRERRADGDIDHLSVFALAPQPLLLLLGSLLIDIGVTDVYQRRREPPTWSWSESDEETEFIVREPEATAGPPALILSLSATVSKDRIYDVAGDATVWELTVKEPHNDFLRSRRQLSQFRTAARRLLDRIKSRHGQDATLSIFPAMPVATAVELGRVRMPKADLPWRVFDQVGERGFIPALNVPFEEPNGVN